jgi:Phasin protein
MSSDGRGTERSASPFSADFAAISKKRLDDIAKAQESLFEKFQDVNRRWLERWQAEAKLLSEFGTKLAAARSLPEATSAYQELTNKQLEMMNDDAKQLMADGQTLAEAGARMFTNGWPIKPTGTSS